jgi:succinate dehydrogenase/fumarate reductase cytochrome b subunit
VAVFLLIVQAWVIHRLAGIRYPLWNAAREDEV